MRLAQVIAVHTIRRTVDIVFTDTSLRVAEVHVLSSMVASDAGVWNFPSVQKPATESQAGALPRTGRQLAAVIDQVEGRPVVVGFIHPLGGQIAFNQDDRVVDRHVSGAYTTIAPDGSIETYHPSGAYVRIGTGAHEPLSPFSAHQNWDEKTSAPAPTITVHAAKFDLTIDPSGNVTFAAQGTITVTGGKAVKIAAGTSMELDAPGGLSVNANTTVAGTVTATGQVVAGAGAAQVGLLSHRHGTSGPPTPGT